MMRTASWSVALVACAMAVLHSADTFAAAAVGKAAPALVVQELNGTTFNLAVLRGKVVVINLWATWCPPCRREMPALDSFYRQYRARGVEMLALSVDRPRDRSEVKRVMGSFAYPAAMWADATANDFGSPSALPVTFVIDRNGTVRKKLTPDVTVLTEESLAGAVLPLLGQGPVASSSSGPGQSGSVGGP